MSSSFIERLAADALGSATVGEFRRRALDVVQRSVGADSASFLPAPRAPVRDSDLDRTVALGASVPYREIYVRERARFEASLEKMVTVLESTRKPVVDSDIYTGAERRRLACYTEILAPQRTTSLVATLVTFRGCSTGLIALKRHDRGAPFGARQCELLESLIAPIALLDAGLRMMLDVAIPAAPGRELLLVKLSPRERELASYISLGLSNGDIALIFGTSANTVRNQASSIFLKLGASNRTELAAWMASRRSWQ
jgi:DNA-binding CsgD family transcriptional regulator